MGRSEDGIYVLIKTNVTFTESVHKHSRVTRNSMTADFAIVICQNASKRFLLKGSEKK